MKRIKGKKETNWGRNEKNAKNTLEKTNLGKKNLEKEKWER